jgi:hypothetical protein
MPPLINTKVVIFYTYPFVSVNGKLTTNYYLRRQSKFEEDATIIKSAVKQAVDDSICLHSKFVGQETIFRMNCHPNPVVPWQNLNIPASKISPLVDKALKARSHQISDAISQDVYSQLWVADFLDWFYTL